MPARLLRQLSPKSICSHLSQSSHTQFQLAALKKKKKKCCSPYNREAAFLFVLFFCFVSPWAGSSFASNNSGNCVPWSSGPPCLAQSGLFHGLQSFPRSSLGYGCGRSCFVVQQQPGKHSALWAHPELFGVMISRSLNPSPGKPAICKEFRKIHEGNSKGPA